MSATGARSPGAGPAAGHAHDGGDARTPAQWYCLLVGAVLLLVGIVGFFVNSKFNTGSGINGSKLIIFEVNGWHNIVHLLSGLVLLAVFAKRKPAKTVAIAFGAVYALVAIIGLVDGNDVVGLVPVNAADNILHVLLAAAGLGAGLMSSGDDRAVERTVA